MVAFLSAQVVEFGSAQAAARLCPTLASVLRYHCLRPFFQSQNYLRHLYLFGTIVMLMLHFDHQAHCSPSSCGSSSSLLCCCQLAGHILHYEIESILLCLLHLHCLMGWKHHHRIQLSPLPPLLPPHVGYFRAFIVELTFGQMSAVNGFMPIQYFTSFWHRHSNSR